MPCERFRSYIYAKIDGELNADAAAELNAHQSQCASCRRAEARITGFLSPLRGAASIGTELPAAASERILGAVRGSTRREFRVWTPSPAEAVAALAAALLVGALAGAFMRPQTPETRPVSFTELRGLPSSAFGNVYGQLIGKAGNR